MRILVVEDEQQMAELLRRGLSEEGYAVDITSLGKQGEEYAESIPYDLIILDVMLPDKDGISVCRDLRSKNIKNPVLILTALDTLDQKVKGLDAGADDYLIKPFAFPELFARVRALLRREEQLVPKQLRAGDLMLDGGSRRVFREGKPIDLTAKEFSILEYFMRHPDMVMTRVMLEQHVWDLSLDSSSNLIDVYIARLRKKIDTDTSRSFIDTIKGVGYRFSVPCSTI